MAHQDDFAFENMPYKPLPIPIARSKLLVAISEQLAAHSQKTEGKRVMQLSELGTCPDQALMLIIPTVTQESKISIKDGFVCGASGMTGHSYRLFDLESPALKVFNLFNGINSIDAISTTLSQGTGWSQERSFAYTRGLFLSLVVAGLCMPKE